MLLKSIEINLCLLHACLLYCCPLSVQVKLNVCSRVLTMEFASVETAVSVRLDTRELRANYVSCNQYCSFIFVWQKKKKIALQKSWLQFPR